MEMQNKKTPISTIREYELTSRLDAILKQAYMRRSRQLPNNIAEIVETLKGDLLKHFPDCPIETIDDAIILETLHNPDTALSPTFFYNAVKKVWFIPKTNNHQWDVEEYCRPSMETDTINLLNSCAEILQRYNHTMLHTDRIESPKMLGEAIVSSLPAFNARREFAYLVMRGQLDENAWPSYMEKAIEEVNRQRIEAKHNRVIRSEAENDPDVKAMCKRLAVLDWLRSCNVTGITPSAILKPLINESEYQIFRKENA